MQAILDVILQDLNGTITITELLLSISIAFVIGIFIVWIYRKTYTGVVYSNAFVLCIIMLSMVTSIITRTISSNITLSLGMVGALSIVRFRTAVKEPLDTAFMFWAIGAGIMTGAGMYLPSIIGSLIVGMLFFIAHACGFHLSHRYLLVIKCESQAETAVEAALAGCRRKKLRSKALYQGKLEYTYELEIKDNQRQDELLNEFRAIEGLETCSLVAYQNDFGN